MEKHQSGVGELTIGQVKELNLTLEEWVGLLADEEDGLRRVGVTDYVEKKIEELLADPIVDPDNEGEPEEDEILILTSQVIEVEAALEEAKAKLAAKELAETSTSDDRKRLAVLADAEKNPLPYRVPGGPASKPHNP